jgi:hypothetical protein
VWSREEAFAGPYMDLAPDLTLELRDGGLPSIAPAAEVCLPRTEPSGAHHPEGIFIMHGPGVRCGARLPPLSICDVAPLLLHTLGLPVPSEMEGRVPAEAFTSAALNVETTAPPTAPAEGPEAEAYDPEAEHAILARLRALGYTE